MRARGLKHPFLYFLCGLFMSRPMRARGLKLRGLGYSVDYDESRPMRARGLKLVFREDPSQSYSRAPCGRVG